MEGKVTEDAESPASSSTLYQAVKMTLRTGLLLSGCFFGLQSGFADTTDLPTVQVPPPAYEPPEVVVEPPPYEPPAPPPYNPFPDDGDSGSSGSGSTEPPEQTCARLRLVKPNSCPNPIPMPSGRYYAQDQMPGAGLSNKSTIMMAIAFAEGRAYGVNSVVAPDPTSSWTMGLLLEQQTANFANAGMPSNQANAMFRSGLVSVCNLETWRGSNGIRPPGGTTVAEQACFDIMKAFDQDTNDQMTFVAYILDWAKRYGVPLDAYIPGPVKSATDPGNSVMKKWEIVSRDANCSSWWHAYEQNQCSIY